MKFRKLAEWEDHSHEPGGDEIMLLEAVDVPMEQPRYLRVSWSELTAVEFNALERGEVIERSRLPRALCKIATVEKPQSPLS